ncbi:hypothetical protein HXX76_006819 [Chlamydomonas incerta]|uniref:Uncharacterized protein n=1 Tax=Chlamydomonas incerta TaxID=51695 RepID=A0A835T1I8_CHLIN|nr:hypothetical protein HXX76_006819 [Chlamydomonas incerta]|eukprot:KAG2435616.1 hypothetical protein HXX76_006819 [Chlamydomonas incerta]
MCKLTASAAGSKFTVTADQLSGAFEKYVNNQRDSILGGIMDPKNVTIDISFMPPAPFKQINDTAEHSQVLMHFLVKKDFPDVTAINDHNSRARRYDRLKPETKAAIQQGGDETAKKKLDSKAWRTGLRCPGLPFFKEFRGPKIDGERHFTERWHAVAKGESTEEQKDLLKEATANPAPSSSGFTMSGGNLSRDGRLLCAVPGRGAGARCRGAHIQRIAAHAAGHCRCCCGALWRISALHAEQAKAVKAAKAAADSSSSDCSGQGSDDSDSDSEKDELPPKRGSGSKRGGGSVKKKEKAKQDKHVNKTGKVDKAKPKARKGK